MSMLHQATYVCNICIHEHTAVLVSDEVEADDPLAELDVGTVE